MYKEINSNEVESLLLRKVMLVRRARDFGFDSRLGQSDNFSQTAVIRLHLN